MVPGYESIIQKYRPAGYMLKRSHMTANDGLTQFTRDISVDHSYTGREALFIYLHEFGHVKMGHMRKKENDNVAPPWVYEFEADQYAIRVMRSEKIAIPRGRLVHQKLVIQELITQHGGSEVPDDEVLRYAFGRDWRRHRT